MESTQEPPFKLASPDPHFTLTDPERATIRRGFDADALAELLAHIHPDYRANFLKQFQTLDAGGVQGRVVKISDIELQAILDRVWAPYWADVPPEGVSRGDMHFPGAKDAAAGKLYKPQRSDDAIR